MCVCVCQICLSALYGKLSRERPLHVAMVDREAKRAGLMASKKLHMRHSFGSTSLEL